MKLLLALMTSLLLFTNAYAKIFVDFVDYEDRVYSKARKTQLGDILELLMSINYTYDDNTFARFRFQTRPEDNREVNKTDRFEFSVYHRMGKAEIALDTELLTNDGSKGGMALSFDLDSEATFIKWQLSDSLKLNFFPFNFDGEVGEEFNTWDVTRIYFIDGLRPPGSIGLIQGNQKIVMKTIPGLVLEYNYSNNLNIQAGFGVASYVHPVDSDFDIVNNPSVTRMERREDVGYQLKLRYRDENTRSKLEYVGHSQAKETGALLEAAGSFYTARRVGSFIMEGELTYSKAGKAPWNINMGTLWFADTASFEPVFSDYLGNNVQDWVGQSDVAYSLRLAYQLSDKVTPYIFYRHQGEHFIFNDFESAHLLRNFDLTKSHGGLDRVGFGAFHQYGKSLIINPEVELQTAQNPVYSSSSDVQEDRYLGTFKKSDLQITLFVTYNFAGNSPFGF